MTNITWNDYSYGRLTLLARKQYLAFIADDNHDIEVAEEMRQNYENLYAKARELGEMS
jgi:hypothetical protein